MKQQIDFDQWNELTEKEKLRLDTWLMKKFNITGWNATPSRIEYIPRRLMTIGEMIDFLAYHELPMLHFDGGNAFEWWGYKFNKKNPEFLSIEFLCDKLWETVIIQLRKKSKIAKIPLL